MFFSCRKLDHWVTFLGLNNFAIHAQVPSFHAVHVPLAWSQRVLVDDFAINLSTIYYL